MRTGYLPDARAGAETRKVKGKAYRGIARIPFSCPIGAFVRPVRGVRRRFAVARRGNARRDARRHIVGTEARGARSSGGPVAMRGPGRGPGNGKRSSRPGGIRNSVREAG